MIQPLQKSESQNIPSCSWGIGQASTDNKDQYLIAISYDKCVFLCPY